MRYLYHIILFLAISISHLIATPQSSDQMHFLQSESINIANGLSSNDVTTLYLDSRGYIWIATYDGLNCYNGYNVTIYKNSISNKFLPSNRIRVIKEDSMGRLWIGTDEGIVVYDYHSDDFIIRDEFQNDGIIRDVAILDDLIYVISESKGVYIYDMQLSFVGHDSLVEDDIFLLGSIEYDNSLLIASSNGVVEYNPDTRQFIRHLEDSNIYVNSIVASSKLNTILLGTSHGLVETNVTHSPSGKEFYILDHLYSSLNIKSLIEDHNGKIWIGSSFDGLIYDPAKKSINSGEKYLVGDRISNFLLMNNGDMWVSTFNSGAMRFTRNNKIFNSPIEERPLKMTIMDHLDEDHLIIKSDNIIHIYNTTTGRYETTPKGLQQLFYDKYDARYFIDATQHIWAITSDCCYRYDYKTGKVDFLSFPTSFKPKNTAPTSVSQDSYGNIWVGYVDDLLKLYVSDNNTIERVESILDNDYFLEEETRRVRIIYHDIKTASTWIGTDLQGIFIIPTYESLLTAEVQHYLHDDSDKTSLSSSFVSTMLRDRHGVMWIGTEQGGLCKADESGESLSFKYFTEEQGLSNNVVKSILCDSEDLLWITTNVGLNSFDPVREQFHTYRVIDGLPFEEFLYSATMNKRGELFFSGINKFLYFNPDELPKDESLPRLHFKDLKIYDQTIAPNTLYNERVILKRRLKSGDSFTLKSDENTFSISIDAIYDASTSSHHYAYILEPTNSRWIKSHVSNNVISFNGLRPGKYTLRVLAFNSYGYMTNEQQLYIKIKRPMYGSVVAYIIYALLLTIVIVSVVYFIMRNQELNHKLSLESQEKETLRVSNLEKQRYFSNISHELKTPLTLILAPLAILADRFKLDLNMKSHLTIMQRQVRKMLQLIDLAHDIQLSDENMLTLKSERFFMRDLLKEIVEDFKLLATYDNKEFKVEYPDRILGIVADRSMIEKVLNNLLNNAFKYTVADDSITIDYGCEGNILTIRVSDSGAGITPEDQERIFDRFYTSKSIETKKVGGTGIGLAFSKHMVELHGGTLRVESEYGVGSTFIVELPIVEYQKELSEYNIEDNSIDKQSLILGSFDGGSSLDLDPLFKDRLIYLVEDNGEMRAFISEIIARYFTVKSYANASECLEEMQSQWPDIIVSDVMMPGMGGDKMCEVIKNDLRTSHIPIILLTARYTIDDKINGIEMGADFYIGKPFYPKHLIACISSLLKGRQRLIEQFQMGLPLIRENQIGGVSKRDSDLITSLYRLFDENLDNESVEIDSFAVELGVNRSLFYTKIKALTDMSPYELLKNYRLQQANKFIRSGQYNVNEVSDMTGFKNRAHFSRLFKQHFGVSPSRLVPKSE